MWLTRRKHSFWFLYSLSLSGFWTMPACLKRARLCIDVHFSIESLPYSFLQAVKSLCIRFMLTRLLHKFNLTKEGWKLFMCLASSPSQRCVISNRDKLTKAELKPVYVFTCGDPARLYRASYQRQPYSWYITTGQRFWIVLYWWLSTLEGNAI